MESELIHTSHTHSLLVAQLLRQAEKWHLTMTADMSSLENKYVPGFTLCSFACVTPVQVQSFQGGGGGGGGAKTIKDYSHHWGYHCFSRGAILWGGGEEWPP